MAADDAVMLCIPLDPLPGSPLPEAGARQILFLLEKPGLPGSCHQSLHKPISLLAVAPARLPTQCGEKGGQHVSLVLGTPTLRRGADTHSAPTQGTRLQNVFPTPHIHTQCWL